MYKYTYAFNGSVILTFKLHDLYLLLINVIFLKIYKRPFETIL